MKLKKTKKSFKWLIKHSITVFSCVLIIALGIVLISYAATTIGTNIDTGGDLTVSGNTTLSGDLDLNLNELKDAVLEKLATFPSSPVEGQMFYSTASSTPYWYTGAQWKGDVSGATFVVAASDSLNKEKADYICDGTADDVQIQAAIDALPSGGGKVILMEGTYTVSATITTSASSTLQGVGKGTVLTAPSSAQNLIEMGNNCKIGSFKVDGTIDVQTQIEAGNDSIIQQIEINGGGGVGGAIDVVNKENVAISNVKITNVQNSTNGWAAAIHVTGTSAKNIYISNVYIKDSDRGIEVENGAQNVYAENGYIENVIAAGSSPLYSIGAHGHLDEGYAHNVTYRNFYIKDSAGFRATSNCSNVHFENIRILDVVTNPSLIASSSHSVTDSYFDGSTINEQLRIDGGGVVENTIFANATGFWAIRHESGHAVVSNCEIYSDPSSPSNYGIRQNGGYLIAYGNYIHGNFNTYAIHIKGTLRFFQNRLTDDDIFLGSDSQDVDIINNTLTAGSIIDSGTNNKIYDNRGYATATSSTATITSGNTYVAVTHLLDITPATSTVSIIPLEDLGNASTTNFWISDVGASTFRINVGTDPGKDVDFSWNIGSY